MIDHDTLELLVSVVLDFRSWLATQHDPDHIMSSEEAQNAAESVREYFTELGFDTSKVYPRMNWFLEYV